MAEKEILTRIQHKYDTQTNWDKATGFTPKKGELIIYSDIKKFKVGDGNSKLSALEFYDIDLSSYATKQYADQAEVDALAAAKTYANSLAKNYATAAQGAKADTALQPSDVTEAAKKNVDSSISNGSTSDNLPTSAAVASFVEGKGYTTNNGTVTSVVVGSGLAGGTITGSGTISHGDTSSQSSITASGRKYITGVTLDTYGHVTGLTTGTETVTDTNTTYDFAASASSSNGNVKLNLTAGGSGSGTDSVTIKGAGATTVTTDASGNITISSTDTNTDTDTGATSIEVTGSGNAVTAATYDASSRKITLTKGATYNNYSLPNAGISLGGVKTGGVATISGGQITAISKATSADSATTATKVGKSLTVGSKTYDGSSAVTVSASDLGLSNALHFIGTVTSLPSTGTNGDVVLMGSKEYVYSDGWVELGDGDSHALKTVTISAGGGLAGGGDLTTNRTISHADTSSQASISASGRRYITGVTLDGYGHVTALTTGIETVANTDTTYDLAASKSSTNGNVKVNLTAGGSGSGTDSVTIKGSGATTVTTDANGVITINSTDNNTTYTFNGAVSTIKDSDLTVSRALISNSSGKVAVSDITSTELSYLDGVTSNIQTQLNGKAASSHNHSASNITSGTIDTARLPAASGTSAGITIVYPAASCTTFSSDSGTVTPLAVQKGAKMFSITRPSTATEKAIVRYSNTDGDVQNSKIIIEDVTNTRDTSKTANVIAIPAEGNKKMVYGYCTDQIDGTSFIGGVFDADATEYPYSAGLAIGGTSGNLLWKGAKVATVSDIPSVGNGTVTIKQNGTSKGSFTLNQSGNATIELTDTDTNTTYSAATQSAAGLMSAADKKKLDGVATGANAYSLPTASSSTLGGVKTTSTVTSTSGLTACPIISGVPYYKDTNNTYSLSSFGITATAAELNKLDGITATTAELNYTDGVTSNIQTQLNAKQAKHSTISVTLSSSSWSSKTQTVTASGVTTSNSIVASPAPASHAAYSAAGVYCSAQASGKLTFTCDQVPSANLTVNIMILG